MAEVWFCSDLHFGHKNISKFRKEVSSEADNVKRITSDWKDVVRKRDVVYVLGDAAFTMEAVKIFDNLPGIKNLVRGNHDLLDTQVYLKYFNSIYGFLKYKEFWLSHAPIHPDELRNKVNLHGHVHYESIRKQSNPVTNTSSPLDERYFNCCAENLWKIKGRSLINIQEIRKLINP